MDEEAGSSSRTVLYVVLALAALCGCGSFAVVGVIAAVAMIGTNLEQTFNEVSNHIEAAPPEQAAPDEAEAPDEPDAKGATGEEGDEDEAPEDAD